jgi:hypothetical protein
VRRSRPFRCRRLDRAYSAKRPRLTGRLSSSARAPTNTYEYVVLHFCRTHKKTCAFPYFGFTRGCQKVYFVTKNPDLGKFWNALRSKMSLNFMSLWSMLPFGIFMAIWYTLRSFWYIFHFLVCRTKTNLATLVLPSTL